VWSVIRSGVPLRLNEISDEHLQGEAQSPEHLAIMREIGVKAALIVPIRAGRRVLGAISLISAETDARYDAADEALAEELGRRVGVALENAQLYAAAQAAAQSAEEASRAKDEFLATVSHELRTPLAAILGWSTLLKDRISDPTVVKPIAVIHRNAQAQVKIIDDILDVSRVITGKLRMDVRATDLAAITRDALEVIRPSADAKRIKLELTTHCDPCPLVADPERLQQVVWNLLSNAVKFTEAGGTISVSVAKEDEQLVLEVRDTGKGIEPEFLPLVFDRFRQADPSTTRRVGGLGLGLALVRHIVELHGGRVIASSEGIGAGTTMTIILPIRAVTAAATLRAAELVSDASTPSSLTGIKVLVVDDEPDARDVVAAVLLDAGAEVDSAGSAAEGFQAFKRFRPDVLVSDIGMPDEDGYAFIRRVRGLSTAEGGRIPSLALTAFAREEDRSRAISAGFTTHIGKPVNPAALVGAVANLWNIRARG
jgi:signal transduction histidine kinase/CheY-like chemotaxis protein